jgi:hypothetical protein
MEIKHQKRSHILSILSKAKTIEKFCSLCTYKKRPLLFVFKIMKEILLGIQNYLFDANFEGFESFL